MSNDCLLSVILSVRNGEKYLNEAIESIQRQTLSDIEIVIVDDGSTDKTSKIISTKTKTDTRINHLKNEGIGLAAALNYAASLARGTWLARMDGDDIALPDRFYHQINFAKQNPDVVAFGTQALVIEENGFPVYEWRVPLNHSEIDEYHLKNGGGAIIHPTAFIRKSAFEKVGGYNPALKTSQDLDLWLRLAEVGRLANIPRIGIKYRLHFHSTTVSKAIEQRNTVIQIQKNCCRRRNLPFNCSNLDSKKTSELRFTLRWIKRAFFARNYITILVLVMDFLIYKTSQLFRNGGSQH